MIVVYNLSNNSQSRVTRIMATLCRWSSTHLSSTVLRQTLRSPLAKCRHKLPHGRQISLFSRVKAAFKTPESEVLDKITTVPFYELFNPPLPIQLNWIFLFLDAVFTFVLSHTRLSWLNPDTEGQASLWPGGTGHTTSQATRKALLQKKSFDLLTNGSRSLVSTLVSDPSSPYDS